MADNAESSEKQNFVGEKKKSHGATKHCSYGTCNSDRNRNKFINQIRAPGGHIQLTIMIDTQQQYIKLNIHSEVSIILVQAHSARKRDICIYHPSLPLYLPADSINKTRIKVRVS
jgi:hypothetical protein